MQLLFDRDGDRLTRVDVDGDRRALGVVDGDAGARLDADRDRRQHARGRTARDDGDERPGQAQHAGPDAADELGDGAGRREGPSACQRDARVVDAMLDRLLDDEDTDTTPSHR
jgi:hypothetical protein